MSKTYPEFIEALASLGLMPPEGMAAFLRAAGKSASFSDVRELANLLVSKGNLTRFQATALWEGAAASLQFGDYIILDKIGAGGMGHVYKAQHRRMKRILAIKMLHKSSMPSESMVRRFFREVESAAKLNHPNIVTAYDAGEQRGEYYLAMEFVDGKDVAAVLKERGPLPMEQAVNIVLQACTGLAYAHSRGIVHRDIKPANLLLSRDGMVKVLDMGLARSTVEDDSPETSSDQSLTMAGKLMGTVEYMSPEQAADPRLAGPATDIYALGCTLYRLLTGKLPYPGNTPMEIVLAHKTQPIPQLSDAMGAPAIELLGLQQALEGMMAKTVEQRFGSVEQVIAELRLAAPRAAESALVTAAPLAAETFSSPGPVRPDLSRPSHGSAASAGERSGSSKSGLLVTGAVVAVVGVIAAAGWWMVGTPQPSDEPVAQTPTAPPDASAPTGAPPASPVEPAAPAKPAMATSLDILPLIDPARDAVSGQWEMRDGSLLMTEGGGYSRLRLPVVPPRAYRLEFTMQGSPNKDGLALGLVGEGRQFRAVLGGYGPNHYSGIGQLNKVAPDKNETRTESFQFIEGQAHRVVSTVEPGHVLIQVDGQSVVDWNGDMSQLTSLPQHSVGDSQKLFLSVGNPGFAFSSLKITSLDGSAIAVDLPAGPLSTMLAAPVTPKAAPNPADKRADALTLIKLDQHALTGTWRSENGAIVGTPPGPGKDVAVTVPITPAESYRLEAEVTRVSGDNVFWVRLPHGSKALVVGFDNFGSKHLTGPDTIGGKRLHELPDNGNVYRDFRFTNGKAYQLACSIEPGRLIVQIDGKEVYRFEGDLDTLGGNTGWMRLGDARFPVLGGYNSELRISRLALTPLTPAAPALAEGAPVDLVPLIEPEKHGLVGTWRSEGGSITVTGDGKTSSMLAVPYAPPLSYRLEAEVTRVSGAGCFIGLPRGSKPFVVSFEDSSKRLTGPQTIGDVFVKDLPDYGNVYMGFQFTNGQPSRLACTVEPGRLIVAIDGKEVYRFEGDMQTLGCNPGWLRTLSSGFPVLIFDRNGEFTVSRLTLTPLGSAAPSIAEGKPAEPAAGKPVDLLSLINLTRDAVTPGWTMPSGKPTSPPGNDHGRLAIPYALPSQYMLQFSITKMDDVVESANIGLVVGGRPCYLILDGYGASHISGVSLVVGRTANQNSTQTTALTMEPGRTYQVSCKVTPSTIRVAVDGKTIIDWTGDPADLSRDSSWSVPDPGKLFIGSHKASYRYDALTLTPLKPTAKPQGLVAGPAVDLMPLLNVARDTVNGKWALSEGVLMGPSGGGNWVLRLPVAAGESYQLAATIRKKEDAPDRPAVIGLVAGGKPVLAVFGGKGVTSGLSQIGGRDQSSNETTSTGLVMKKDGVYQVLCTVDGNHIKVEVDGATLVDWTGDVSRLSRNAGWDAAGLQSLFVGSASGVFDFQKLTFAPLVPAPPADAPSLAGPMLNVSEEVVAKTPWIDLLPLVDVAQDVTNGRWDKLPEGLRSQRAGNARLALPLSPVGCYELDLVFNRLDGAVLGVHLPAGDQSLLLSLGQVIGGSTIVALGNIDGAVPASPDNPTRKVVEPMASGVEHHLLLRVLSDGTTMQVVGTLNDQKVIDWTGPLASITTFKPMAPRDPARLGLVTAASRVLFTRCNFRMLQGSDNLLPRAAAIVNAAAPGAPKPPAASKNVVVIAGPAPNIIKLTRNQRIDLLKATLPARDGKWSVVNGGLIVDGRGLADFTWSRMAVRPTGVYEFTLHLQNKDADGEGRFLIPVGPKGYVLWALSPDASGFIGAWTKDWRTNSNAAPDLALPAGSIMQVKVRVEPGNVVSKLTLTNMTDPHIYNYTLVPSDLIPYAEDTTMALGVKGQRLTVREFRLQQLSD